MKWLASIIVSVIVHAAIILKLDSFNYSYSKVFNVAVVIDENVDINQTNIPVQNKVIEKPKSTIQKRILSQSFEKTLSEAKTVSQDSYYQPIKEQIETSIGSAGYEQVVLSKIESAKRYPRSAQKKGLEGTTVLSITIAETGSLLKSEVLKSSGFEILDSEVLQMAQRAAPFPNFPEGFNKDQISLLIPVEFQLR